MTAYGMPPTDRKGDAEDLQTLAVGVLMVLAIFRVGVLVGRRR